MNTPMLDYVIAHLEASKGRWPAVAAASGVSLRTIEKIARREVEDPRISNLQRLHDHFRQAEDPAYAPGVAA